MAFERIDGSTEEESIASGRTAVVGDQRIKPEWVLTGTVVSIVAIADVTLYRAHGFAGPALFLLLCPLLVTVASKRRRVGGPAAILYLACLALAAKLVWCGSMLQLVVGTGLLAGFAMAMSGQRPYVLRTAVFVSQTVMAGYAGLYRQWLAARTHLPRITTASWLGVVLPITALTVFGALFVLANPDVATAFGEHAERLLRNVRIWFVERGPRPTELLFWVAVAWIATGALRPLMRETLAGQGLPGEERETVSALEPRPSPFYTGYRNTLLTVVALFTAYLLFEFRTLWFREFPPGFHYSGYAHEGAFWLTVSLGLATLLLSAIFRGDVLDDPRVGRLKRLAWAWSGLNVLLAVSVYNRLLIYVGFNGMTRMRVVGFLGISAVVAGFLLVLRKIAVRHDFIWLVRRQLWAVSGCVFLYAVLPVDALVMRYNVSRILAGDPAPSVQISVHPIDAQGLLQLSPLLTCDDEAIRDGVRAILSAERESASQRVSAVSIADWTRFQYADRLLERSLQAAGKRLTFADPDSRRKARDAFDRYAYQWY